jgi:hypothetical protein
MVLLVVQTHFRALSSPETKRHESLFLLISWRVDLLR